jgi:hypothetical protein
MLDIQFDRLPSPAQDGLRIPHIKAEQILAKDQHPANCAASFIPSFELGVFEEELVET